MARFPLNKERQVVPVFIRGAALFGFRDPVHVKWVHYRYCKYADLA